jgi:hypothetical protein
MDSAMMVSHFLSKHEGNLIFNKLFIEQCMQQYAKDNSIKVLEAHYLPSKAEAMVFEARTKSNSISHPLGIFRYGVSYQQNGRRFKKDMILKSKISDEAQWALLADLYKKGDFPLSEDKIINSLKKMAFINMPEKEIHFYGLQKTFPILKKYTPLCYGSYYDKKHSIFVVIQDFLGDAIHASTPDDDSAWDNQAILNMLDDLSAVQALWYNKPEQLKSYDWLPNHYDVKRIESIKPLLFAYYDYSHRYLGDYITQTNLNLQKKLLDSTDKWWQEIESFPKTISHGDLTLKNIALKEIKGQKQIVMYDWEILHVHLPQRDTCELLSYLLTPETPSSELLNYIEVHRKGLEAYSKIKIDKAQWRRGYLLSLYDYFITRLQLFIIAEPFESRNIKKLYQTTHHMIEVLS